MASSKSVFAYPDNLDLEEKVAYGVGALVMHWGACEAIFYGLLEVLAGRENTANGAVLWLSTRNNRDRLELIQRLAKVQTITPVTVAEISDLCRRFKAVTKVRNFFCHASYRADATGTLLGVYGHQLTDQDDPISEDFRPITAALLNEIKSAAIDTRRLHDDVWLVLIRLREALKVQQPTLPPGLQEYLGKIDSQPRP